MVSLLLNFVMGQTILRTAWIVFYVHSLIGGIVFKIINIEY